MQKVAVKDHPGDEMELVTLVVEGLKDLALLASQHGGFDLAKPARLT